MQSRRKQPIMERKPHREEFKRRNPIMAIVADFCRGHNTSHDHLFPTSRIPNQSKPQRCTYHLKQRTPSCSQRRCMRGAQKVGTCLCCPYAQASDDDSDSDNEEQLERQEKWFDPPLPKNNNCLEKMLQRLRAGVQCRFDECETSEHSLEGPNKVPSYYENQSPIAPEEERSTCSGISSSSDTVSELGDMLTELLRKYNKKELDDSESASSKLAQLNSSNDSSKWQGECKPISSYSYTRPPLKENQVVIYDPSTDPTGGCFENNYFGGNSGLATKYSTGCDVKLSLRSVSQETIKGLDAKSWNDIVANFEKSLNKNETEVPTTSNSFICDTLKYDRSELQCTTSTDSPLAQETPKVHTCDDGVKTDADEGESIIKCAIFEDVHTPYGETSSPMSVICEDGTFSEEVTKEQVVSVVEHEDRRSAGCEGRRAACSGVELSQETATCYKKRQCLVEPDRCSASTIAKSPPTPPKPDNATSWSKIFACFGPSSNKEETKVLLITDMKQDNTFLPQIGNIGASPDKDQQTIESEELKNWEL